LKRPKALPKIKVLHHIEEEEGELFPKVRKIWNTTKREQVGRQMEDMKERQKKASKERRAA
jgi:hemerythrin superfamily protein